MKTLTARMIEDMQLRGLAVRTQEAYLLAMVNWRDIITNRQTRSMKTNCVNISCSSKMKSMLRAPVARSHCAGSSSSLNGR